MNRLAPLLAGLVSATVYLLTQAPGLMYTDTGELAAAAKVWGVAHPTGYPLLTVLAHVWTMLPWPSVIGGLNILAALFTAGSVAVMCILIQELVQNPNSHTPWLSASVSMAVGFSPLVWSQSTAFEVYSLNILLVTATMLFAVRAVQQPHLANTMLAGLLFGLTLANHLSAVFLAPGLLLIWWHRQRTAADWIRLLLPISLGLSLYALLPLRSATLPPINWGWVHRGWDAFLYHVKGSQFGVWMFSDSGAVSVNTNLFFAEASTMLFYVGWIPVVVGAVTLMQKHPRLALGLLAVLAGNLVISLGYAIPDIDAYFLPSMVVLAALFGIGLSRFLAKASRLQYQATLIFPVLALAWHAPSMNYRNHSAVEAYANWTWDHLEPNAVLITRQWDLLCSAMWYQQVVDGKRRDVAIIDKELLRRTWYLPHLQHQYPKVMQGAQAAINDYMPWLENFEADSDEFLKRSGNSPQIQQRFEALLKAILDSNTNRPLYITPELLNEEGRFTSAYRAIPVASMLRLTKDSTLQLNTHTNHLTTLAHSLQNHHQRLDSAMQEQVIASLAQDAMYALRGLRNETQAHRLRDAVLAINPRHRISRALLQQMPTQP